MVLVLLTWTAVDLLAPQLCAADASQPDGAAAAAITVAAPSPDQVPDAIPADRDDCFCCSHTVRPAMQMVLFVDVSPVELPEAPPVSPFAGIARSLYHPPLFS